MADELARNRKSMDTLTHRNSFEIKWESHERYVER